MFGLQEALSTLNTLYVQDVAISEHVLLSVRSALYTEESSHLIISTINKYLSVSKTRDKGFEILYRLLPDCTKKILDSNGHAWVNFAVSLHPNEPVPPRRLQIISKLIAFCHTTQDFHKAIVNNLLGKIIETCVSVHPRQSGSLASLECLNKCMRHFSSTSVAYKTKLHNYFLQFIDLPLTDGVLENAASCYHYINQIGGAGVGGSLHIKKYSDGQEKLYNTLDALYDKLFENVDEYCETKCDKTNTVEFAKISSVCTRSEYLKILGRRLRNVTGFIAKSLECGYPVRKCIKPELLLQVVQRGLATHVHAGEKDMENVLLSVNIQKHQIDLLLLLKSLITCLGQNFIRFSTIKLLLEYLARTKNCDCFKWNSEYKVVIYEVLELWILNSGEYLDSVTCDKIMRHIIEDITPMKTSLTLNIKPSQNKSNKNKQNDVKNIENPKEFDTLRKTEYLEAICYQALVTLETFLKKILLTVKDTTCTLLYETIIKNLLNISVNVHETPYTSEKCRKMLYKTLIAVYDQNYRNMDIGLAINILSIGVHNFDTEVSNICSYGLLSLEKLCQPTHFSLDIPAVNNNENAQTNGRKSPVEEFEMEELFITSDVVKTMEVTDSYLVEEPISPEKGSDKQQDVVEKIINISDEDEAQVSGGDKKRRNSDDVLLIDDEFVPAKKKVRVLADVDIANLRGADDVEINVQGTDCIKINVQAADHIEINMQGATDDIEISSTDEKDVTEILEEIEANNVSENKADSSLTDNKEVDESQVGDGENDDMLSSFVDEVTN